MAILHKLRFLFIPLLLAISGYSFQFQIPVTQQPAITPTPTYDPLAEPTLPPNPTEIELGRNLYWHWCMPCHGDRGQGLTDEFRGVWEADHQNCWARGCHTGRQEDMGFPIPTIVPGLVDDDHLARFSHLQGLSDYLQATHPPQSPGILKSEEYHAIALFVFTMNGRPLVIITSTAVPVPAPTETMISSHESTATTYLVPINLIVILVILTIIGFVLIRRVNIR